VADAPSALIGPDSGGGPASHFVGSGEFADLSFGVGDSAGGFLFGSLNVFQGSSGGTRETQLSYFVQRCDFLGCTFDGGFGVIPNGDFSGTPRGGFTLGTNTSFESNPNFFRFSGDGGPVEITWRPNGVLSTRQTTTSQSVFGDLRQHITGTTVQASADARGVIVGTPVPSTFGNTGSFQNVSVTTGLANVRESVSGSGQLVSGGELRSFTFAAVRLGDGRVLGEWQRYNRAADSKAHGRVTCFTVSGDQVWLGGTATTGEIPGEVAWRARDNGPSGRDDQISLQFVGGEPGFAQDYCARLPDNPPLLPLEGGNIILR
jgi:hypothetical protein